MTRITTLTAPELERLRSDGSIVWLLVRTERPAHDIRCPFDGRLAAKLRDPEAGPASGAEMVRLARMLQQSARLLLAYGTGSIYAIGHIEAFSDRYCRVLPDHWVSPAIPEDYYPVPPADADRTGVLEPLTSAEAGKMLAWLEPETCAAEHSPERLLLPGWLEEYILPEPLNVSVTGRILLPGDWPIERFDEDSGAARAVSGEFFLTVASVPVNTDVLIVCREPDRISRSGEAADRQQVTVRGSITGFNAAYSRFTGNWTFYLCMEYHSVTDAFGKDIFVSYPDTEA
ncbi:MAG: hypothetical protein J5758_04310 [Abditibacteriota bacterium]|nr:hypothetical protein [Abditibacteriota bacterium]